MLTSILPYANDDFRSNLSGQSFSMIRRRQADKDSTNSDVTLHVLLPYSMLEKVAAEQP